MMEREAEAFELLRGLVAIPSLSCQEAGASAWLVAQMQRLGYERAFVDDAGNAVGEIGPTTAQHTVVLLGHIDTVPGNIPVKQPTAQFSMAAAAWMPKAHWQPSSPPLPG
jgi:LysW-gamma-L-lysine carboxypeptidase